MRFDLYVHFDFAPPGMTEVLARLDAIAASINGLTGKVTTMSAELDRLTTEVTEMSGVVDSAVALIGGLADQIRQLQTDPAALAALADSLDAKANELAAAVAANTTPPGP